MKIEQSFCLRRGQNKNKCEKDWKKKILTLNLKRWQKITTMVIKSCLSSHKQSHRFIQKFIKTFSRLLVSQPKAHIMLKFGSVSRFLTEQTFLFKLFIFYLTEPHSTPRRFRILKLTSWTWRSNIIYQTLHQKINIIKKKSNKFIFKNIKNTKWFVNIKTRKRKKIRKNIFC